MTKRPVYADYFTSLHTRECSGQSWIWRYYHGDKVQWSGDLYESPGSDRKDISAPCYPRIGLYDTLDPAVVEYHILLAKAAGIDGFLCEYDTHHGTDHDAVVRMAQIAAALDFKIGIHWIPVNFTNRTPGILDRVQMLDAARDCLAAVFRDIYDVAGATLSRRPLILIFGIRASDYLPTIVKDTFFSATEITALRETFKDRDPLFLAPHFQAELVDCVDGFYPWVLPFGSEVPPDSPFDKIGDQRAQRNHLHHFYSHALQMRRADPSKVYLAGVWPGFDDHKGRAWGEDLARYVPRDNGAMLELTWKMAEQSDADAVLHITWNDWVESTMIEPSREFGSSELEATGRKIAHWKDMPHPGTGFDIPEAILQTRRTVEQLRAAGAPVAKTAPLLEQLDLTARQFAVSQSPDAEAAGNRLRDIQVIIAATQRHLHHKTFVLTYPGPDFSCETTGTCFRLQPGPYAALPPGAFRGRLSLTLSDAGTGFIRILQFHSGQSSELADFRPRNAQQPFSFQVDILPVAAADRHTDLAFEIRSEQPFLCKDIRLDLTVTHYSEIAHPLFHPPGGSDTI